jgi:lysophospholipase L1-like esterase
MNTQINTKRILIYGNSITYGRIPGSTMRYNEKTRYPCVLQDRLGTDYEIIEEGLRGRRAYGENARLPYRNGFETFPPIYLSHAPLDLVIIFLGTNDTQKAVNKSGEQIANELLNYIPLINKLSDNISVNAPEIIFVIPPKVQSRYLNRGTKFEGAEKKSVELAKKLKEMVRNTGLNVFDSNAYIETCEEDGVHLNSAANLTLGTALAKHIKKYFS